MNNAAVDEHTRESTLGARESSAERGAMSLLSLSDELIVHVICMLADPAELSYTCRRLYYVWKDPWTRSTYFMCCGKVSAFGRAIAYGHLLEPKTLDIMLSSGACMSRYLVQCVIGHYTKGACLKWARGPWCRAMKFSVFSHFVSMAATRYGDHVNVTRGQDDASVIELYINRKKYFKVHDADYNLWEAEEWKKVHDIFTKYNFLPFDDKDPAMSELPMWFSTEPRLLPLARANGYHVEPRFRDRIFQTVFSKVMVLGGEAVNNSAQIIQNVKALSNVDDNMFLSRTVAAEICLDSTRNPIAYSALRSLDLQGCLRFDLAGLVFDLIKMFKNSFLVSRADIQKTLHSLCRDFPPPEDPVIRSILIRSIFMHSKVVNGLKIAATSSMPSERRAEVTELQSKMYRRIARQFTDLDLAPITKLDLLTVLESPKTLTSRPVMKYARKCMKKIGLTEKDLCAIAEAAAVTSLRHSHKGLMIRELCQEFPSIELAVKSDIEKSNIDWTDLRIVDNAHLHSKAFLNKAASGFVRSHEDEDKHNVLGRICIHCPAPHYHRQGSSELYGHTISDELFLPVPTWVLDTFGPRSLEAAVFFTHSMANNSHAALVSYAEIGVPVTLKHFKLRIISGEAMNLTAWKAIETQPFYRDEFDYINQDATTPGATLRSNTNKREHSTPTTASSRGQNDRESDVPPVRKRPRRSAAAAVKSYAVDTLSSDEENGMHLDRSISHAQDKKSKRRKKHTVPDISEERNMNQKAAEREEARTRVEQISLWIEHLSELFREENQKFKERKQDVGRDEDGRLVARSRKTAAHIDLSRGIPDLQALAAAYRASAVELGACDEDLYLVSSDDSDGEYGAPRGSTGKRKRVSVASGSSRGG